MFYPTISPHDPNVVVLACDMTGAYLTRDAGRTWRMFNLGDTVRFFVFDPNDAKVIYAGSGGGLYRSADAGATWSRFHPRADAITKATRGDDHAAARLSYATEPRGSITAFAVDPTDSRSLFAANFLANRAGLWQSTDGGGAWQKVADLTARVSAIWIQGRALYAAGPDAIYGREGGRWRTGASPGTFTSVSAAGATFYATVAGRIFVSDDGGSTWHESSLPGFQGRAETIAASPNHPEIAYVSFSNLRYPVAQTFGVAKTTDGGRHWELVRQDGREPAANFHDAWLSERFNTGWGGAPRDLAVAPGDPSICYGTDSGRTVRTLDGGKTWNAVYSKRTPDGHWTTNGLDVTTSYGVHFDPFDARHMFISYTDIGLWASDNGGESWYSATRSGVPGNWVNTTYWVEFDPKVRGRMWAAMSETHDLPRPKMWRNRSPQSYAGGVVRSDDGGRTWRVQSEGMPPTAATHILRTPEGTLYVAGFGRGVFQSTDGGEHWALKNDGIEGTQPFAWRVAADSKGVLYLVVARRSDDGSFGNTGDGALYRSTDSAAHWTRLRLPEGVNGPNGLAIDPRDPVRLYLAAWGRSTHDGAADGGIYLSTDGGAAWRRMLDEDQHIYDVTIDPTDPRILYAAGFEQNAWRSADRGLTWKKIPGYDFRWGHRVILHAQDHTRLYVTTFGGSVWTRP
jgi:photosystem II stability/assembly factor-like uncharacterized protein